MTVTSRQILCYVRWQTDALIEIEIEMYDGAKPSDIMLCLIAQGNRP
jgi:hypothetical protein